MNRKLFWKLSSVVALGTVTLFWVISELSLSVERKMSQISHEHQQVLAEYARQAETLFLAGDMAKLNAWIKETEQRENSQITIARKQLTSIAGSDVNEMFDELFYLGRDISWPIHLEHDYNPIMNFFFADGETYFLIVLPARMRPGAYWSYTHVVMQIAAPLLMLFAISYLLYRHLMEPLDKLQRAVRRFSGGDYAIRVGSTLKGRNDEIAALARTFDRMAEHLGNLIIKQRRLIADLSHELRTPITRIEMAVASAREGVDTEALLPRIERQTSQMRQLVEDTLTLAWLENEVPVLKGESLDLVELLDSIIEEARFEYPDRNLHVQMPDTLRLAQSNHRALGQAVENVLRNALRYTPPGGDVLLLVSKTGEVIDLRIEDEGPGVPDELLESIFRPFYRVESARGTNEGGFGLGLALAKRQIQAVGGAIKATNRAGGGLSMSVLLPL